MSSGERSIGAAKGKQTNAKALCQTPPRKLETHYTKVCQSYKGHSLFFWAERAMVFVCLQPRPPPPPAPTDMARDTRGYDTLPDQPFWNTPRPPSTATAPSAVLRLHRHSAE